MTRKEANNHIVQIIQKYVDTYPDLRFEQILYILGFHEIDFNTESTKTLSHVLRDDHLKGEL